MCSPIPGEVFELLREEESEHDQITVCLLKPGAVTVGHVPRELSRKIKEQLGCRYFCACHVDLNHKLTHKNSTV